MTGPGPATLLLAQIMMEFLLIIVLIALAIGFIDLMWQQADHIRKNRMSDKELRDEHKETEGDPHMKQARRERAQKIAANRMLADVPDADVVIVKPTHFAVALKWDRRRGTAPTCVAKGQDVIAKRIRELAIEAGRADPQRPNPRRGRCMPPPRSGRKSPPSITAPWPPPSGLPTGCGPGRRGGA